MYMCVYIFLFNERNILLNDTLNMYIQIKLSKHMPVMGTSSVIKGEVKGFIMY